MVAVGVGADDGGDPGIADGAQYRLNMAFSVNIRRVADAHPAARWAGIDHRNVIPCPHQPSLRAGKSVRRRIGRKHAANQRFMLLNFACFNTIGPFYIVHSPYLAVCRRDKKRQLSAVRQSAQNIRCRLSNDHMRFSFLIEYIRQQFGEMMP